MAHINSQGDLFEIISEIIGKNVASFEEFLNFIENDPNEEAYEVFLEHLYEIEGIDSVQFDLENVDFTGEDFGNPEICGYHSVDGVEFIGIYAGGDWEHPVYFIVYPYIDVLRAYVPTKGNTYNIMTGTAIGSEGDEELCEEFLSSLGMTLEDTMEWKPDAAEILEDISNAIA